MTWRNLFNIPISGPAQATAVIPGQAVAANAPPPAQTVGSFVTPESVATFSGMTAAITLIWTFIEGVGGIQHRLWIGAAIAVCCGALLYGADASDPNRSPSPARQWRILAALVNTILLFNAASGSYDLGTRAMTQNAAAKAASGQVSPASHKWTKIGGDVPSSQNPPSSI